MGRPEIVRRGRGGAVFVIPPVYVLDMEERHRSFEDLEAIVSEWSEDELTQALGHWETIKAHAVANQVAILYEADRRQLPMADGCRTVVDWAAWRLDISHETARLYVGLARRLAELPDTAQRLTNGSIGPERAAAIASISTSATETQLLDRLAGLDIAGVQRFAVRHKRINRTAERSNHDRSYVTMQPSLDEGWWTIHGGVSGLAGATIHTALRERADEFPSEEGGVAHRQGLALEAICADWLSDGESDATGSTGASVTAFVDLDLASSTAGEAGAELAFGPRLGPDALSEVVCSGSVRIIGLSNGLPVATTSKTHTIPPAVRDFVLWRDGGCRTRGCGSRYRLQPHHISLRSAGGSHHPDNLITLCWFHHHVVIHRRGYTVTHQADGSIQLVPPSQARDPP